MTKKKVHNTPPRSPSVKPKVQSARARRPVDEESSFREVVGLIEQARERTYQAVNTALIDLYWQVGEYISRRITDDGWGRGTVAALAQFIRKQRPESTGFSAPNLWRMRQFVDTYRDDPKLSPLVRELPWTHNLLILSACKRPEAREFYLRLSIRERWGKRELERQLAGALFERTVLSKPKVSPLVTQLIPAPETIFKDAYLLDFLDLPDNHSETDLQSALVKNLRRFLVELGGDFCFVGEYFRLQVGGQDFFVDLVFFHRQLQCLVAIELKIVAFQPEHLGKLEFYLEALDRDVRKPHERPSIGILLCATKDDEIVEYALARSVSPALIAEYQTQLPDKKLLQRKLHEFYQLALPESDRQQPRRNVTRSSPRSNSVTSEVSPVPKRTRSILAGRICCFTEKTAAASLPCSAHLLSSSRSITLRSRSRNIETFSRPILIGQRHFSLAVWALAPVFTGNRARTGANAQTANCRRKITMIE